MCEIHSKTVLGHLSLSKLQNNIHLYREARTAIKEPNGQKMSVPKPTKMCRKWVVTKIYTNAIT